MTGAILAVVLLCAPPVHPPRQEAPRDLVAPVTARGVASWYSAAPAGTAAAGPALRAALGPGWRGMRVRVTAGGRSVVVVLSDWCRCGPRHGVPTLLDLAAPSFARLAPLSRGVLRVTVARA